MINSGRRLWFVLLLVGCLFLSGLTPAFASWTAPVELSTTNDTIFTGPNFPTTSSLAVQKNGVAHIFYVEKIGKTYSIIHHTNKTGSWQKETVMSSAARLSAPAAAFRKGRLYLAWARGTGRGSEIVYATNAGGAWSTGRMTDNSAADLSPAIAVRRGKVYISWIQAHGLYADGGVKSGVIRVRSNASGRWVAKTIGDTYFSPSAPVLEVDGAGAAHIVYSGKTKSEGASMLIHADNAAGEWRQERLPVNVDKSGAIVSAEMPSLALYRDRVYVAFTRMGLSGESPQVILAVKRAGAWRVRALTKKAATATSLAPRIAVYAGRVRVAYTKVTFTASGEFKSEARYIELANGQLKGETIDSEAFTLDPYAPDPPPLTVFMIMGFEDAQGLVHTAYLRVTLDLVTEEVVTKIMYARRDP